MKGWVIVVLLVVLKCEQPRQPVVGILTIPRILHYSSVGVVDEIYYNYLRQGSLQVLAIPYWYPNSYLRRMIRHTNLLFLQGGVFTLAPFLYRFHPSYKIFNRKIYFLLDYVVRLNRKGTYYPVVGICMGMQHIANHFAGDTRVLMIVNHIEQTSSIEPTQYFLSSPVYANMPPHLRKFITTDPSALYYNHHFGITQASYNKYLKKDMKVLGWFTYHGTKIISSIQHRQFPIYGFQNHFEKSQYQARNIKQIPRGYNHIRLGFYIAKFIHDEAMKSPKVKSIAHQKKFNLFHKSTSVAREHVDPTVFKFRFKIKIIGPRIKVKHDWNKIVRHLLRLRARMNRSPQK